MKELPPESTTEILNRLLYPTVRTAVKIPKENEKKFTALIWPYCPSMPFKIEGEVPEKNERVEEAIEYFKVYAEVSGDEYVFGATCYDGEFILDHEGLKGKKRSIC